jgi:hypothetical protein
MVGWLSGFHRWLRSISSRLFPYSCKVPADAVARELFGLGAGTRKPASVYNARATFRSGRMATVTARKLEQAGDD